MLAVVSSEGASAFLSENGSVVGTSMALAGIGILFFLSRQTEDEGSRSSVNTQY